MATPRSPVHLAYGRALRQLRADRGFSQEKLALAAGLDRTYVSGIERGERNPSLANIAKLAETIGVPISTWASLAEELVAARGRPH